MVVFYGLNNNAGTERVCSMIANGLSEAGHEIVLASMGPSDKPFFSLNEDVKIISLLSSPNTILSRIPNSIYKSINKLYRSPNVVYRIRRLLKKEAVDIIIAVDTVSVQFTLPATLGLRVKHIGWEHFNFEANQGLSRRSIARHLAAQYCDSIITLTERDKECWLKNTYHKSQIITIANPCPFPVQEYIEENKKIVLAVGRLNIQKGFDLLLESWIQVIKIMPEWKLKIVGEGEERAKLTKFVEENQITESVELVGMTSDLSQYYRQAKIFCLSSRVEGFGMVLTEALAFGIPIVSFDCGPGPAEILKGTGSILVPKNDVNQLAISLISLMNDDEQRKTIRLRGKKKVEIYQPDNIISKWLDLLKSFE
jgi:glycosyltransferase involved in cell wall biosynthesis